jgi:hypothetical protein
MRWTERTQTPRFHSPKAGNGAVVVRAWAFAAKEVRPWNYSYPLVNFSPEYWIDDTGSSRVASAEKFASLSSLLGSRIDLGQPWQPARLLKCL